MSKPNQLPISDYKYWAFISYSHRDNRKDREDRYRWGDWLHDKLENFKVPEELVGKPIHQVIRSHTMAPTRPLTMT